MNDDLAFIDAILKDESDDTSRLVYADWLADHGEPELGAFVRLQTEVYLTPNADPRRIELRSQEKAAWKAYQKKWQAVLALGGITRGHFTRGVIANWKPVHFPAPEFVEQSGGWGSAIPVHRVYLDRAAELPRIDEGLAACPFLARLLELRIGSFGWDEYERLAVRNPAASMSALPDAAVLALARSPHLGRMQRLEISTVRPTRVFFARLAECPMPDRMIFDMGLVPYSGWGQPWFSLPLRWFNKPAGKPIAQAVDDLVNGPSGEHLID